MNRDDGQIVTDMIAASEARVIARVAEALRTGENSYVRTNTGLLPAGWVGECKFAADLLTAKPEPVELPTMTLDAALAEIAKLKQSVTQKAESNRNMSDLLGRLQREVNEARIALKFARA